MDLGQWVNHLKNELPNALYIKFYFWWIWDSNILKTGRKLQGSVDDLQRPLSTNDLQANEQNP